MRVFLLSLSLFISCFTHAQSKTIRIAAIDWCPQICVGKQEQGYVVDIVKEVYKDSGYKLEIEFLPWSRAIKYVLSGKADALLSPAKAEAPELLYPNNPVGAQTMCFYTEKSSNWTYQGRDSLAGLQIGIAIDTSIEELNDYVATHPEQFQFQPYHERFILQNAGKLTKRRMDTFLFTQHSTQYELQNAGQWENYREAGCVSRASIYMAFSPAGCKQRRIGEMVSMFEQRMTALEKTGFIKSTMEKYGLSL